MFKFRDLVSEYFRVELKEGSYAGIVQDQFLKFFTDLYSRVAQIDGNQTIRSSSFEFVEMYGTIDLTQTYVSRSVVSGLKVAIPHGTFEYVNLTYDANGERPVPEYKILCEDNNYFILFSDESIAESKTLFYEFRSEHVFKHHWHFYFPFDLPYQSSYLTWPVFDQGIVFVPGRELAERRKAFFANLLYCTMHPGSSDGIDSLMAVAFGRKYAIENGEVKSISKQNDGSSRVYIDSYGTTCVYDVPKLSSKISIGSSVRYMQSLEESPVRLVSLDNEPHRFAHLMTAQSCMLLKQVGGLRANEKPQCPLIEGAATDKTKYDFGDISNHFVDGNTQRLNSLGWSNDQIAEMRHVSFLTTEQEKRYSGGKWLHSFEPYEVNPILYQDDANLDFRYWNDLRFGSKPWEMFANVVVWETIIQQQWHNWIQFVLDFFKPAHQMYAKSPWAGVVHDHLANYSNYYGAYYGGDRYTLNVGYGANYGRRS